jgi:putative PIN family toxin of toxin-antitoxin system
VGARSPRLVLDTNIVLDCLVFDDPMTRELTAAMEAGHIGVLAHQHTIDELERVLAYPQCHLAPIEQRRVLERYLAVASIAPMPEGFSRDALLVPRGFPRCRDRDDDLFLALAYHSHATALVTKDRALLKLRRKVRNFGFAILAPSELLSLQNALALGSSFEVD